MKDVGEVKIWLKEEDSMYIDKKKQKILEILWFWDGRSFTIWLRPIEDSELRIEANEKAHVGQRDCDNRCAKLTRVAREGLRKNRDIFILYF